MDYKATLNLPQTDFPMKASLPIKEPLQIAAWNAEHTYRKMLDANNGAPKFTLHDGPPYANGNIHMGHTLNKVLKDILIKYKNLSGYKAAFIPGWDCHGLPIELGVEKQLREKKIEKQSVSKVALRNLCKEYAQGFIDKQSEQFQRLGILADWQNPYRTMSDDYVAQIIRELGTISASGALYKGNKPVYWCAHCVTALADAEIEYHNHISDSVYVKFQLTESARTKLRTTINFAEEAVSAVIWTTTPWTLPANLGIAMHPELSYVVARHRGELLIVAEGLLEKLTLTFQDGFEVLGTFSGRILEKEYALHPFEKDPAGNPRTSLFILGDHVTLEAGTGLVHTAPGHGVDDYRVGLKYGLSVYAPVDNYGKLTAESPLFQGLKISDANPKITEHLKTIGALLQSSKIEHSYPHCWRCTKPVIFRATPQWFISVEDTKLRQRAIEAIKAVEWIPQWGINRILGMMESRPDWCISRQRTWGVPITVFYCEKCNDSLHDQDQFNWVADLVEKNGPNVWYEWSVEKLIKPGSVCKSCSSTSFRKETDILDVWFDSGVSHAAVLASERNKSDVSWPADLYLEGSDQHRGWFQTSLLTGVETRGRAPFKAVLTHGFVNDKDGKKMSKSKGNVIDPIEFCNKSGAEILRLWVIVEDYRNDVNFSFETIDRVSESYRKIRNSFRYILGNLYDFDATSHSVPDDRLCAIDQWALTKLNYFLETLQKAYEAYEFHVVYHAVVNFCVVELSSLYFDILKDRLYTLPKNSAERRSSQTVLFRIAESLALYLAPILSFTSEEVWGYLKKTGSVFEAKLPVISQQNQFTDSTQLIDLFFNEIRTPANKVLEQARANKEIGLSLDAALEVSHPMSEKFRYLGEDVAQLLKVSEAQITASSEPRILVKRAEGKKCERCWRYSRDVGGHSQHAGLCKRCVEAVSA